MTHRIQYFVFALKVEPHAAFATQHISRLDDSNQYMRVANDASMVVYAHNLSYKDAKKLATKYRTGQLNSVVQNKEIDKWISK